MGDDRTRRALLGLGRDLGLGLSLGAGLLGTTALAQPPDDFASDDRRRNRLTVQVRIAEGPDLTFAIDTAANSSVIAADLLEHIPHRPHGRITMHTLVGAESVDTVRVDSVRSGVLDADDVRLAVGDRAAMQGLDGLLGSELLLGRRLVLDFRRRVEARIAYSSMRSPSRLLTDDPGTRLITPLERRFRSLMMIEARLGRSFATAIVDSGATMTMMNEAAALAGRAQPITTLSGEATILIQSPTGRSTPARLAMTPLMSFADAQIARLPVLVGDFHTFDQWGLAGQPALLLGVDVLGLFDSVSIDLRRREFVVTV